MSTKISVIVPVYNIEEEYLRRCINSIVNQTYKNFELLLIDDGSTDGSGKILEEYAEKFDFVKAFHKENGGSSSARNLGIEQSTGDYLSFIDSDDYIEPDFLESLAGPIERAKAQNEEAPLIVQVGRDEIDDKGKSMPDICTPPLAEKRISNKDFFKDLIMHVGDCSFCTKITSKSLFVGRFFPVGKLNEDFSLLIKMLLECDCVISLPGYKYHVFYRLGSNSRKKDKNDFSRVFKDCVDNADVVEELVKDRFPELKEVANRFALFQRLEYLLHIPIPCMRKDYEGYSEVVGYVRKNFGKMLKNKYLTGKNKVYLVLFAIAPKGVRKGHAKIKHL